MKKMFNLKTEESKMITITWMSSIPWQLLSVSITLEDEVKAMMLLCSFPDRWEGFVMIFSDSVSSSSFVSSKKVSMLKFDDVVGVLLSEDMRRKIQGTSFWYAFVSNERGKTSERVKNNKRHEDQNPEKKRIVVGIVLRKDTIRKIVGYWKNRVLKTNLWIMRKIKLMKKMQVLLSYI